MKKATTLKTPLRWVGGKGRLAKQLVELIAERPHRLYCEPFGGGASVLLAKPPSKVEIYNDLNSYAADFFLCLIDDKKRKKIKETMRKLPVSRAIFYRFKNELLNGVNDDVARAVRFFYLIRYGYGSKSDIGRTAFGVKAVDTPKSSTINHLARLDAVAERFSHVIVENIDGVRCVKMYDRPFSLFYLDPPYMPDTWGEDRSVYENTMSSDEHERMLQYLTRDLQGQAIVSGYQHEMYDDYLLGAGWVKHEIDMVRNFRRYSPHAKSERRTECIWATPPQANNLLF